MKRFMMGSRLRPDASGQAGNDKPRRVIAQLSLLALLFSVGVLHAQQTPPPPPTIGWNFDEFHIGGEEMYHPRIYRDSLNHNDNLIRQTTLMEYKL